MLLDLFKIPAVSANYWSETLEMLDERLHDCGAPPHLNEKVAEIRAVNLKARELEQAWSSARKTPAGNPDAKQAHLEVRRAAAGLDRALRPWLGFPATDRSRQAAQELRMLLFPAGLAQFFAASYDTVQERLALCLDELEGGLAAKVALVRIEPFVARLRVTHREFAARLRAGERRVEFEAVHACQQQRDELLARLVCQFVAASERGELGCDLGPFLDPIIAGRINGERRRKKPGPKGRRSHERPSLAAQ
jgi:hypothetical protein